MVLDRVSTGIAGLDELMEGGIPKGFTVLVAGNPGTGKTILTSHFLYAGLRNEENSVYVSFGESKKQFYDNLEKVGMKFIDYEKRNEFKFLDFASVTKEGIGDALEEVLDGVRNLKASRMVIDSFSAILLAFNNINEARIALQVVLGKMLRVEGITTMLITEIPIGVNAIGSGMEEFVADGIIQLVHGPNNAIPSMVRVVKMRGTAINRESHVSVIAQHGMTVYPKESLKTFRPTSKDRIRTGIDGLDERVSGGFLKGTISAVTGASGSGKTTFGFQFLADAVLEGQKAIFCSLEESPDEVRALGQSIGYDMVTLERKGLHLMSMTPENQSPDAIIAELASQIEAIKPAVVFVDSLTAFEHLYKEETYMITKRLSNLFRRHGITAVLSIITPQQMGLNITSFGVSSIFHNIVLLRYVEIEGQLKRSIIILKVRASPHDLSILEFTINSKGGIKVLGPITEYVGILGGTAQKNYDRFMKKEREIENKENERRQKRKAKFYASQNRLSKREKEVDKWLLDKREKRT
jgi:circadian clock protein KaiC